MVRRRARIGRERRIEVLPLHGANHARDIAVAGVRNACQGGGKVEQECVPVPHSQRASCGKDRSNLTVGQSERRQAPGIRSDASARNATRRIFHRLDCVWLGLIISPSFSPRIQHSTMQEIRALPRFFGTPRGQSRIDLGAARPLGEAERAVANTVLRNLS
jgi:hypothetical protein